MGGSPWPFQLRKLLHPVFDQLGFGFEVRQRAVGGWHEAPYSAGCLHNRAGTGVDVASWEWGMFSDTKCVIESFVREAYSVNGAFEPPPTIISLEGAQTDSIFERLLPTSRSHCWKLREARLDRVAHNKPFIVGVFMLEV